LGLVPAQQVVPEAAVAQTRQEHGAAPRRDIQGLRALAVGLVVVYHLRPNLLPGGFVGVDVFFVISGFLIIGTLTGQIRRTGRLGLADFYARRIRRLLPAASVVLVATTAVTVIVLPISLWPSILREVAASSLDIQNWALAILSTDYAHATVGASPVQHFWSLSVEEQFYLVIPLVMLLCARLATRRGANPVRSVFVGVAVVTVASLAFSVYYTPVAHGPAYFVTPTRMWELGLGGLAAIALPRLRFGRAARVAMGWLGLVAVGISAGTLTTDLAFPGWIALLPTVGTLGLLLAGVLPTGERAAFGETASLLGRQPLRYVGDISYSVYLWHWPIIVFTLDITGAQKLDRTQVVAILALSLVLAAASKHFVEDPFRQRKARRPVTDPTAAPQRARPRARAGYLLGATLVVLSLTAATIPWQLAQRHLDALTASITLDAQHPGALALDPDDPRSVPSGVPLEPDPAVATQDYYMRDLPHCAVYDYAHNAANSDACTYGAKQAPHTIVIVGDSHAGMYSSALADFVKRDPNYRVKIMMRNGCPFTSVPPSSGGSPLTVCATQNRAELAQILTIDPSLVITAAMSPESYAQDLHWTWPSRDDMVAGYRSMLTPLSDAHIPVAVVREVPRPPTNVPQCVERNPQRTSVCDTSEADAMPAPDPLAEAAGGLPGVSVVDLTRWLCFGGVCPAVIGNVVVYRDNHLTNTYVRTLSTPLTDALGLH
jgi:peptidoglycan/LPS O-acetylase OafA/YrhL